MKILLLGSGALKIGQAGEFDYSGSQAIKALKEEGHQIILINPNIATIQTSKGFADKVYFLPVTPHFVEQVIKKEKPQGIILSFGGQTALNCGLELNKSKTIQKYNIKVLGTTVKTIEKTEDRELFTKTLKTINLKTARSIAVSSTTDARKAANKIGFPVMVRAGFSLGGQGSGLAVSISSLNDISAKALSGSHQILIEEYLSSWKEVEYEVVRDKYDNCITVCNMENFDPMGIHTGESIVIAPSQTLNNYEYHKLREISIKLIKHLKIVGECNVQFALNPNPKSDEIDYRIIEVNARLSRSSALASKATGYPLAYVAAKLALGKSLIDIKNSVTKKTTACFEPALDYIVVKFPRWDLSKFIGSENTIGSYMQSVGEVMAIGRKFEEAIQKAVRMLDIGLEGITDPKAQIIDYAKPTPWRIFSIAQKLKANDSIENISSKTGIDKFFINKLKNITDLENNISKKRNIPKNDLLICKKYGFSDKEIARITKSKTKEIRKLRTKYNIQPWVKQIDTLAAEYPAKTNYLYLTYNGSSDDVEALKGDSVIVIGSGPYRIGSSVEFDWCSVNAAQTAQANNIAPIIINCNPETVSTDYDMAARLYFEELTEETVFEIWKKENSKGVIVSMGGQKPNNLTPFLSSNKVNILGTSPKNIDRAEDRKKFSLMCDKLKINQPAWATLTTKKAASIFAQKIGYPVLIRPSYVLSGAAMNVAGNKEDLKNYLTKATDVSDKYPVVISKFYNNAKEIDLDAVANDGRIECLAISEHVENAGVHSGDSSLILPAQKLYTETVREIEDVASKIAKELIITGPFNIQFLAIDNKVSVIECNLRASRSLPFVSKVLGVNFAKIATEAILGKPFTKINKRLNINYVGVKSPQFSFSRIKSADPVLRVEMASTGEVGTFGDDVHEAFLKSFIATGNHLPSKSVFIAVDGDKNKLKFVKSAQKLLNYGLKIYATAGTSKILLKNNIPNTMLFKIHENKKPNALDVLSAKKVDLVINIFNPYENKIVTDSYKMRRLTIDFNIPLLTNLHTAELFVESFVAKKLSDLKTLPWSYYVKSDTKIT